MNLIDELNMIQIAGRRLAFTPGALPKLAADETLVLHARQPFGSIVAVVDERKHAAFADELERKMWSSIDAYAVPTHLLPVPGAIVADATEVGRLVERAAGKTAPKLSADLAQMWHADQVMSDRIEAQNGLQR